MTMADPGPVLITGCSSGIGRATAQRLASSGLLVYASARRSESLAELERAGCRTLALDVTDDESARAAVQAIEAEHGSVGALVNNAGFAISGAIEAVSLDDVRREFETNVFGYLRMAQLVLPGMRSAGRGRIVNLSSVAGRVTMPGAGPYAATKYAIEALSDALRFELRGFGIDVSLVEPGLIRTRFGEAASASISAATPEDEGSSGPYSQFNRQVARITEEAYEGTLARLGAGPQAVAETIATALSAKRPKPRYPVTASARLLINQRRLMPDRAWDLAMRRQFPTPRG